MFEWLLPFVSNHPLVVLISWIITGVIGSYSTYVYWKRHRELRCNNQKLLRKNQQLLCEIREARTSIENQNKELNQLNQLLLSRGSAIDESRPSRTLMDVLGERVGRWLADALQQSSTRKNDGTDDDSI